MLKVLIRAPLLSCSGYGTHSRQIFKWLLSRKDFDVSCQIVPWGITPWLINSKDDDGLANEAMKRSKIEGQFDLSVQVQLPNEWDSNLASKNIGITAAVETDKCNPEWIDCCNSMDMVIVPSKHVKKTIQNTGSVENVQVVPESYYDCIKDELPDLNLDFDTDFNFLIFGQLTGNNPENDRKNLFYTVKYLCESFSDDPNVGIVIKSNSGRNTKIDRNVTTKILTKLLSEVRKGPYPKFHLLHGTMTQEEIGALYRHKKIKALVTLTRGEGFGLPILEAAASGLPVIATRWSGHTDFLSHGKFLDVNYHLKEIHSSRIDNSIFISGTKWAEPDETDAKRRLEKFRRSPDIPKKWAKDLQKIILEKYSHNEICRQYNETIEQILE
jgi:glycosyltransferase involved in cell wall biosynthesis